MTDVPGMYSLDGYSNEEKIAANFLNQNKDALVVNICDANNLERNLKLTTELKSAGFNVVLAVNMFNEVQHNYKKLAELLDVVLIEIDARSKKSVACLKETIFKVLQQKKKNESVKIINKNVEKLNYKDIFYKIKSKNENNYKFTDKLDKLVLNKAFFLILFFLIVFLIFYITFGQVGEWVLSGFEWCTGKIFGVLGKIIEASKMSAPVKSFFIDGLLAAVQSVLSFIPQIVMLMFFLNLLEDTGFMSRVAFMFDGAMKKFGLTGKSLFSLMMGFGCTTGAVMTTRNLENKNLRKRTALLLPFMSCTAKLPIFLVISSLFFENYKFLFVFLLYVFGVALSLVFALIYRRFVPDSNDLFILEMPKYRFPNLNKILRDTFKIVVDFLIKVATTILIFTSAIWVLQNFSIRFEFLNGENFENSILYFISSKISCVFGFIGLKNAGIVAAIIFGLVAKELVVVGLAMINGAAGSLEVLKLSLLSPSSVCHFTPVTSIVFLVFVLLYSPCVSALGAIRSELGVKTMLYVLVVQFLLSYFVSGMVYGVLTSTTFAIILLSIILLDIMSIFVLKLVRKKKSCWGNCNGCGKICGDKKPKIDGCNL